MLKYLIIIAFLSIFDNRRIREGFTQHHFFLTQTVGVGQLVQQLKLFYQFA